MLAYIYENGLHGKIDPDRSYAYYCAAAEYKSEWSMFSLGRIHTNGMLNRKQDRAEGLRWYQKAAELGDESSMREAGYLLWSGNGVTENPIKAIEWFAKGAAKGNDGRVKQVCNGS